MIHTVLINSRNLYSGTITNGTYLIDWTLMPEKKYLLRWGFGGGIVNGTLINKVCLLHMDLGQSKTFVSDDTVVRSKNTQCIGVLVLNEESESSFLYGDKNINSCIFLQNRPSNNEFKVSLKTLSGDDWLSVNSINEYIINLSFEEIE